LYRSCVRPGWLARETSRFRLVRPPRSNTLRPVSSCHVLTLGLSVVGVQTCRERVSSLSPWGVRVQFVSLCDSFPPFPFIDARGRGKRGKSCKSYSPSRWDVFSHVAVRQGALKRGRTALSLRPPRGRVGCLFWSTGASSEHFGADSTRLSMG
jgi:hypothetical protein